MSWGISVRFQTLSLIQRQVAHALLTRPPLSYLNASRRINFQSSVRLECVMHAASVHPEPGSNSRMFVYYVCLHTKYLRIRVSLILAFSFTLFRVVFFKTSFDEIRTCFFALYLSLVVQFSMTLPSTCGQLDYYITTKILCQYLFSNFSKIFSGYFQNPSAMLSSPSWGEPVHYTI